VGERGSGEGKKGFLDLFLENIGTGGGMAKNSTHRKEVNITIGDRKRKNEGSD